MKSLIRQWLSSLSRWRRDRAASESRARPRAEGGSLASSPQSSETDHECSSSELARRNQCLTYKELDDIERRSHAERRFLVGNGPLPQNDLSEMARLAIVDVQRLVNMCRALTMPNDRTERRGRPSASASASDVARPRSLPGRSRGCPRRPPQIRT